MEKINDFIKSLCSSLASGKMYPVTHPQFKKSSDTAFDILHDILTEKGELILGIINKEFVFEDKVLFKLNTLLTLLIEKTQKKEIEKIYFYKGVSREELVTFVAFLLEKEEMKDAESQERIKRLGLRHIKVSSLTVSLEQKKKEEIGPFKFYENLGKDVAQIFGRMFSLEEGEDMTGLHSDLKIAVLNIYENLQKKFYGHYQVYLTQEDNLAVRHAMNVAFLAMKFSSSLGFVQEDILDLGKAALLHDLGNIRSIHDQNVPKSLSPFINAETLLSFNNQIGILPVIVAYECKLRFDAKDEFQFGYSKAQHIASQITAICKCYDSMTQQKLSRTFFPPDKIHHVMTSGDASLFNSELLNKFFEFIGIWPEGTFLNLSDGRTAFVKNLNEVNNSAPIVQVVSKGAKEELVDLSDAQVNVTIQNAINPFEAAREYIDLI